MKRNAGTTMGVLATALGLVVAGCATADEQYVTHEETMSVSEPAGGKAEFTGDAMVIPLHEEQLKVGKRAVDSGQVIIRKVVTTETVSEPIELRSEHVTIERRPGGAQPTGASASTSLGTPFQEGAVTIQLQSEEPVVEKTTVTTGEVVARKNIEMNRQTVQRDVRREDIAVDRSGVAPGTVEESAGAEAEPDSELQPEDD